MAAPLRRPSALGLRPLQPGTLHACLRVTCSLALRIPIDGERTDVSCGSRHRGRMALTAAPVERRAWRAGDGEILHGPALRDIGSAPANTSQLPDKIQPPSAARLLRRC